MASDSNMDDNPDNTHIIKNPDRVAERLRAYFISHFPVSVPHFRKVTMARTGVSGSYHTWS